MAGFPFWPGKKQVFTDVSYIFRGVLMEQITTQQQVESQAEQPVPPTKKKPGGSANILEGPITSTLWKFSIPLMFGFFVNSLYSWIDTYFVAKLGSSAIAAMGFCEQLNFFIFNFGSGISIGASVIIARRMGEGNFKAAEEVTRQSVMFVSIFGVLLIGVLYLTIDLVLRSLGLEGETLALAHSYMSIVLIGVPGIFILFLVNAVVRATGNSVFAMKVMLLTVVVNAVLAPTFIFGFGPIPAMGIFGAGLATALAQISGAVISIVALLAGWTGIQIERKIPKLDFPIFKSIIRLGIPASLQMFSVSVSRISILTIANTFGTSVVAAYALGIKADFFVFMPIFAVGIAIEIITGQHLGAKKIDRIFQFYRTAVQQLSLGILVLGLIVYIFAEEFARIFIQQPEVIAATVSYLHIVVFSYPLFAMGIISTRIISGAGAATRSLAIVAGSMLGVMLPLTYILSQWTSLGAKGIWFGILLGYILFAAAAYWSVRSKTWLMAKV